MVLVLYHNTKRPHTVFNVIKVSIDDNRTVVATTKGRSKIEHKSFKHEKDYQRLTVLVD